MDAAAVGLMIAANIMFAFNDDGKRYYHLHRSL
jgi:hypothetical protein